MRRIFFAAGEVSGDYQAAEIVKKIHSLDNSIEIVGIGGERLKEAGVDILVDISYYSSIGFIESVIPGLKIWHKLKKIKKYLFYHQIDLIILVDNQGVNIPLARIANNFNIPVVYYFPPHISVWGNWNSRKVSKLVNKILTPFYNDFLLYKKAGASVEYVGHPLLELVKVNHSKKIISQSLSLKSKYIIGLFPGSRKQEIKRLFPVLLKTARLLQNDYSITFLVPIASKQFLPDLQVYIKEYSDLNIKLIKQGDYDVYQLCDLVLLASGTASLELALLKIPMIIIYKVNSLTYCLAKLLIKNKMISLPNIILNEKIFPELLQNQVNHKNLYKKVKAILDSGNDHNDIQQLLNDLPKMLGHGNTINRVSNLILKQLHQ